MWRWFILNSDVYIGKIKSRSSDHKIIRSGYKSCRKEVCLGIPKRDTAQDPINLMKTALNGLNGSEMSIPYPPIYRPTKNKSRNIEKKQTNVSQMWCAGVRWPQINIGIHGKIWASKTTPHSFFYPILQAFKSSGDKNTKYLLFTLSSGIWSMFWWPSLWR